MSEKCRDSRRQPFTRTECQSLDDICDMKEESLVSSKILPAKSIYTPSFLLFLLITSFLLIIQDATWPSDEIEKKFSSLARSSS